MGVVGALTVSRDALARSLSTVAKLAPANSTVPMFSGVLLRASEDGEVVLHTTDGMVASARCALDASVEEPFETVVSCKLLSTVAKGLQDAPVRMETDGTSLVVRCGSYVTRLRTIDASDFPEFPTVGAVQAVEVDSAVLADMADHACRMVGRDPSRPTLAGVLVEAGGGRIRMVATDSYRLGIAEADCSGDASLSAVLHGQTLRETASQLGGTVSIVADDTLASVSSGRVEYVSRLVEGSFPNWSALMPTGPASEYVVDAREMRDAIARVGVIAKTSPRVTLSFADGELRMGAMSNDVGEATETVPVDGDGSGSIALNCRYLADAIGAAEGDVTVELRGETMPATFRSWGTVDRRCLLMPVRM